MIQETLNEVYLLYFFNKRSAPSCVIYTCQTSKTQEIFFFFLPVFPSIFMEGPQWQKLKRWMVSALAVCSEGEEGREETK